MRAAIHRRSGPDGFLFVVWYAVPETPEGITITRVGEDALLGALRSKLDQQLSGERGSFPKPSACLNRGF
jgi:hypothetical protein